MDDHLNLSCQSSRNLFCVITANFESTETCSTNTGVDNKPNIAESDFSPAVVEFVFFCWSLRFCIGSPAMWVHAQSNQCADYCTPVWSWTGSLNTGMTEQEIVPTLSLTLFLFLSLSLFSPLFLYLLQSLSPTLLASTFTGGGRRCKINRTEIDSIASISFSVGMTPM